MKSKNNLLLFSLILTFLGFLDAAYISVVHYTNGVLHCTIISGCDTVTTSRFSTIYGVPLSLLGALFYSALIFIMVTLIVDFHKHTSRLFYFMATIGLVVSIILFLIQALVLKVFCQYCLLSEAISFTTFYFALKIRNIRQKELKAELEDLEPLRKELKKIQKLAEGE